MKHGLTALMVVGALIFLAAPAMADWYPDEYHKMHYPQLPDPQGWDVKFNCPKVLADDWLCTDSGPVSDMHIWFSVREDDPNFDPQLTIQRVRTSIWSDNPGDPPEVPSSPLQMLWNRDFKQGEFSVHLWPEEGDQGWYDPNQGEYVRPDHTRIWQLNIEGIERPYEQEVDKVYWLAVCLDTVLPDGGTEPAVEVGWKTSIEHYRDDAFVGHLFEDGGVVGVDWAGPLYDPITGETLDLAFVITPEPSTIIMLVSAGLVGLVALVRYRKRR